MTRKDFVLIAETIAASLKARELGPNECEMIAMRFADALRSTNPQFDRGRFLRACGVEA